MSHYQKMKDSLAKMSEISSATAGKLVAVRDVLNEQIGLVERNPDLSPEGKRKQRELIKKETGKGFLNIAKSMKEEYRKASVSAKVAAEMLLNERPKKPISDTTIKTFERQFDELKMQLMLDTQPAHSMAKLREFIRAQKDPYFAQTLVNEFPQLVSHVLDAAGSDKLKYKIELQNALSDAKRIATSPEQVEALTVFETMDSEFDRSLFKRGIEMDAITDMFGREIADYANRPDQFVFDDETEKVKVGTMPKQKDEYEVPRTKFLSDSIHD